MKVQVIASGSTGNCTLLDGNILLDAGISFKPLQKALKYKMPDYALITHEHGDHANLNTLKELILRGVDVYMTAGTMAALKLQPTYNLHTIKGNVTVGEYTFTAIPVIHDAAEPSAFTIERGAEKILYLTDAANIPVEDCFTQIIIEANFFEKVLEVSAIDEKQRRRILANHLSVEKVAAYFEQLKSRNLPDNLQEVHLIHVSTRHGDGNAFKKILSRIIDAPITAH